MDKATLKALEGSIKKWRLIAAQEGADHGNRNCDLCKKFNDIPYRVACEGCPVKERTGRPYCTGSPYENWYANSAGRYPIRAKTKRQVDLAKEELKFLISLRPKKKKAAKTRQNLKG